MSYYDNGKAFEALRGRRVLQIDVSDGEDAICFRCEHDVNVVWEVWGDCCSSSWWADGFNLNELRGEVVKEIQSIELPEYNVEDGRGRQEEDKVYGYEIKTDAGASKFVFRNSSNGYYGGDMELAEDRDSFNWRQIEGSDWSA